METSATRARHPGFAAAAGSVHGISPPSLPPAAPSATMLVMGVTYELIDAPYPYLCAVYRCRCGAVAVQHANDAATAPEAWEHAVDGDDGEYICPGCAERRRAGQAP